METERLSIRRYEKEDKDFFINLFTNEAVMKHVDRGVLTVEQAENFWHKLFAELYPQNYKIWAAFAKTDGRYIGHCGIHLRPNNKEDWEFVYFLKPEEWGKGFATEIAKNLIEYGFEELNLTEVFATVDDDHESSIHVLEKAGMNFKKYEYDEEGRFSLYSVENHFFKKLSNHN